ncbi:hypothetical protein BH24ACI5_BH24ACI5_24080 [soil metagenome]
MQAIHEIADKVRQGRRVERDEALVLYRHAPTALLGELADGIRARTHPDRIVTYIIDRNVNYTNVCVARCNFCAFYRPVGSSEGYVLGFEEVFRKIDETIELGGGQLLLQGGHNPDLPLEWYEDLFRGVKTRYPDFKLHALSPPEVIHLTRMSRLSIAEVIDRLVAVGLDSIPGGGAEILVDRVRKILNCYNKATADEWLDVMRHAHRAGLRTTATMMYGHVETPEERLEHMLRLRQLQDESHGATPADGQGATRSNTGHGATPADRHGATRFNTDHRSTSADGHGAPPADGHGATRFNTDHGSTSADRHGATPADGRGSTRFNTGFTAFITWSYQPEHTELGGFEATGVEYLRTLALARIVLDNFDNMQASWVTQGGKVGQLSLAYGANDMGSVMIEENVVRAAGAAFCMDEIEIVRNIENAGFTARRRNMHYELLGEPIFRERDVPRMLELAVARHEGDTSRPAELAGYAARSAAEKRLRRSELSD